MWSLLSFYCSISRNIYTSESTDGWALSGVAHFWYELIGTNLHRATCVEDIFLEKDGSYWEDDKACWCGVCYTGKSLRTGGPRSGLVTHHLQTPGQSLDTESGHT